MTNEKKSALFILAACALWSVDLLVRYPLSSRLSFINIVFFESLLGLLCVTPWLIRHGKAELKRFSVNDWMLSTFIGGFGMTIAGLFSAASIAEASPQAFSFFQIFQPILVAMTAHYYLKEKLDNLYFYWGMWVGCSALLMFSQDIAMLLTNRIPFSAGAMLVAFGTMLIWGLSTVAGKALLKNHSVMCVVATRWLFAFIFSVIFLVSDKNGIDLSPVMNVGLIVRLVFICLISGPASLYLYYSGMKDMDVGKVSFLELSYPALSIMLSALVTYEEVTFFQAMGVASIFAFVLLFMSRRPVLAHR